MIRAKKSIELPPSRTTNGAHQDPVVTWEDISPNVARQFLGYNGGNRTLIPTHIENLAEAMREGSFDTTHEGIAFADTGRMLDGQHRMHAIIKSGVTIRMMVTRGLSEATYKVMNQGNRRQLKDRIHFVNDQSDNQLICAFVSSYLRLAKVKSTRYTTDMAEDTYLEMDRSWGWGVETFRSRSTWRTIKAFNAAMCVYHSKHPNEADAFAQQVLDGMNLTSKSPALHLRNGLEEGRITRQSERYWKTIWACQQHLAGADVSSILSASEDFQGNVLKQLRDLRSKKAAAGAETKKVVKAGHGTPFRRTG